MKIKKIEIQNFRLLRNVTLTLENDVTVIVGRNNSGKTSLTELFRRLLGDRTPSFQIEDFSCAAHESFLIAYQRHYDNAEAADVREALPTIEIRLTVSYAGDSAEFGPLGNFIVDLEPACTDALIHIRYELDDGNIDSLFADLNFDPGDATEEQRATFYKTVKERLPKLFRTTLHAVDPNDMTNRKRLDWPALPQLLRSGFINAQRWLDDTSHRETNVLGKVLEALFKTARSEFAVESDHQVTESLDIAVEDMRLKLDFDFNEHLRQLLPALTLFGYPGLTDPELRTETTLDVERLLVNHTKVRYAGANGVSLPEAHNGLGPRNLIFILLQLLEFFKTYQAEKEAPGIQIAFIEEPEAHLHPQMAEVFIRKLSEIATLFSMMYNNGVPWPVQFVVSTHSSHMANEARFETIRYFLATSETEGHHLRQTRIKDLRDGLSDTPPEQREFLHQYMTLTRCDLFFADKAALIEGCSERLLLPKMISKVDADSAGTKLSSQYVSVVEVCGAYAHRFFKLLDFLELRTLIVTDLDSARKNASNKLEKCLVTDGTHTTNSCIKAWFGVDVTPAGLLVKTAEEKTDGIIHLAYEVPEEAGGPCGRTFEDAFMLANPGLFGLADTPAAQRAQAAWNAAGEQNKAEFALRYALEQPEWNVPRYITEGLHWLAEHSADADPMPATPAETPEATVPEGIRD
jgi:putative ATP-dependent endonuclease of the OLD family